ncbi:MAG: hypothetical protein RR483_05575 [Clostridia bacterium]
MSAKNFEFNKLLKQKKVLLALIACLFIICIFIGYVLAYLVKPTERRINNMTVGDIAIELTETEWDKLPTGENIMYPGKTVVKDPTITNISEKENDLYGFFEIKVPRSTVSVVNADQSISTPSEIDLFTFSVSNNWILINTPEITADRKYTKYIYGYEIPITKGNKTLPLFSEVTFANVLEGQLPKGTNINIIVDAKAVQKDYIKPVGDTSLLWLKDIYDRLLKTE